MPKLGLTVAPANSVAGAGKDGVVVTEVDPKSAAAERGFKEGDVILEVAGKSVDQRRRRARSDQRRAHRQQEQRSHAREERRFVALRRGAAGQGLNDDYEMEGVAGISRPRRRLLPGSGSKARSLWLPSGGIRPLRRKGLRAVRSPSFTARFFHLIERMAGRLA